jgi:hypothetical protein
MNSIHWKMVFNVCIRHITSPFNDEFHKEWTWAYLDTVNETHAPSPWHLIGS